MRWSASGVHVGVVFGVPLLIHSSVLALAPFIVMYLALSSSTRDLCIKLVLLPFFAASIVAHELAHARTASALGCPVQHIALTWFGGFAEFWTKPTRRWREALIAFAGPAANLVIAVLGLVMLETVAANHAPTLVSPEFSENGPYWRWRFQTPEETFLHEIISRLTWFNLALGLFNLLPGLPLDGGHILRAGLSTRMSYGRAGWIAAWSGFLIGLATIAFAIWIEDLWTLIIGVFLAGSAWLERLQLRYE